MSSRWAVKRVFAGLLVFLSVVGVAFSYYATWVVVSVFAAGMVWWAGWTVCVSGPLALGAAYVARRQPRQPALLALAIFSFAAWVLLWLLMFAAGFRFAAGN